MSPHKQAALQYHAEPTPGKISVVPTKPCDTARDLSLAYSPGVAEPCLEIEANPEDSYKYTSRGNLVAVISNGTAVLGLGDIGAAAGKPVMEGKGVLFKTFADIDVFDIEIDCKDPQKLVEIIASLAPTFGGINLEDIKAPECFYVEQELKKRLDIPVFHDDQHGTAIIAGAAILNALKLVGKNIQDVRLVVNGAGASAISCTKLINNLGLPKEHIIMCDSNGVIYKGRQKGMNEYKELFAADTECRTLADAVKGADIFLGLSVANALTPEMLLSMANDPIVFAMANPNPEIDYSLAKATRSDVIMATGRSDYPNQVNNVLGFPYIFRGALDVRASTINEEMKLAAVHALAAIATDPVPDSVIRAYGKTPFSFGRDYLIPKPFDPRVLYHVAPAVAKAAMDSGVARQEIDLNAYINRLKGKHNKAREILSVYLNETTRTSAKRIALPEATNPRIIRAAVTALEDGIANPVLVGKRQKIEEVAKSLELDISQLEIIEPATDQRFEEYAQELLSRRCRGGLTLSDARRELRMPHTFANLMLSLGNVDGVICGVDNSFNQLARPLIETVGLRDGVASAAGLCVLSIQGRLLFLADTTLNIKMTTEKLATTALLAAEFAQSMNVIPRIAMLSYSTFGSVNHRDVVMVREAVQSVKARAPHLQIDGEMQVDAAIDQEILSEYYPHSMLDQPANVLIFPDMQSGNIAYKLLHRVAGARIVGPIMLGLRAPAYILQRYATENEILNMITVAAAQASLRQKQSLTLAINNSGAPQEKAANL